jgi:large subunit ribosomal protein L25
MMLTLEVTARDSKESTETLRGRGAVPAVFYGPKEKATAIAIDGKKLAHVWKQAGETTIIKLTGAGNDIDTLIRDVQVHPVSGQLLHADFYALEKGKKIEINVPLHFEGEAPAEKQGHIISKALHEIEIEVAPAELPHALAVDLSVLANIGDHIKVSDIKLPPSATLKTDAEEIVASVTAFVEEKEEAPTPVVPAEIIGEKKEGEGEVAPEGEAKSE